MCVQCPLVKKVIVYRRTGESSVSFTAPRDEWWHEVVPNARPYCPCEPRVRVRKACGAPVSRQHGVECSGAEALLVRRLGATAAAEALAHSHGHTVIDKVLNFYRNTKAPPGVHRAIFEAISGIYTKCLGYQQQANGFWKKPEEEQGRRTDEEEQEPDGGVPARQRQRVAYRPNPGSRRRPSGLPQPRGVG